ncbi:uncharacterized protein HMPREF1541_10353 [Cyphellophora europaea CBS 101466]|uniref:PPIase cyclophilin-type domain-containing protein n=1 Tax=Cyphellophora europaea (strain CBS 101466) TaxID=1220924 RepID=W2S9H0_CYPE1|nr:uncharacterized protein HMPREF1541_10353 [Cyphellophora europaea CBS 101466]ETN44683.1 hypothetical protein HMPREF1541_10353 [Cyphellophora europaea CBS 101466]
MSAHYNLEPPPTATVLLHTTAGDIQLSLFAQQTPLTCRNFLQHCLDGTYDNLPFHRIASDFVIQTGDPTGTGDGGQNIYEDDEFEKYDERWARLLGREEGDKIVFGDEVHSRLKFGRRGLLGMAKDAEGGYGSQWFVTLGNVGRELDGRCTMFGRVEGEGIYSIVRIAEGEVVEGTERPVYPERVTGVEVLELPKGEAWASMKPRQKVAQRVAEEKKETKKPVKKGKKAKAMLSFGDDEAESDVVIKPKKAKFNTALIDASTTPEATKAIGKVAANKATPVSQRRSPSPQQPTPTVPAKRKASTSDAPPSPTHHRKPSSPDPSMQLPLRNPEIPSRSPSVSRSTSPPGRDLSATQTKAALDAQISALKASMRRPTTTVGEVSRKQSALEALIPATSTRGRKRPRPGDAGAGGREDAKALKMLNAFRTRLEAADSTDHTQPAVGKGQNGRSKSHAVASDGDPTLPATGAGPNAPAVDAETQGDEEAKLCDLHFIANCLSCFAADAAETAEEEDNEKNNDRGFLGHQLTFAKDVLGKDGEWRKRERNRRVEDDDGGLVVLDPRVKEKELKRGNKKKEKGGGREWDRGRR